MAPPVGGRGGIIVETRHLFVGFEDVAAEQVAARIPGDVAEYLQILTVVRHVENPVNSK